MAIDLTAATQFLESTARLLERRRAAVLLDDGPVDPVLTALRAYQNPDGGFGNALEPDVRCPGSQPAATLAALEVLADVGARTDPMVRQAADWVAGIANGDGGVPTVLPSAEGHPRAPWMQPNTDSGFLTFALAARLWHLGVEHPWLRRGTDWCWRQVESDETPAGYTVKFALEFLDAVPEPARAAEAVERLRGALRPDGTVGVDGGVEDEKITPLVLSPRPGSPSRAVLTDAQVSGDLDRLEREQQEDGGWDFDFLHWSPGQSVEWRGLATLGALSTLGLHGRA
ncbi:hypothetical protein KRR39_02490 [Nocardioides panacis]|uniref:Prenyltransferase n=1 Tax=Nocardioides panacis TaxID=2849501 RepID=A0A975SZC7_9ACTN|nr:hypothetical protein [Nocardioides panacis]QWZ08744.1 hypothetical protein KRR39_02490 [Nocardioides panacis]